MIYRGNYAAMAEELAEIEITPEMIRAGVSVFSCFDARVESPADLVEEIFPVLWRKRHGALPERAMTALRRLRHRALHALIVCAIVAGIGRPADAMSIRFVGIANAGEFDAIFRSVPDAVWQDIVVFRPSPDDASRNSVGDVLHLSGSNGEAWASSLRFGSDALKENEGSLRDPKFGFGAQPESPSREPQSDCGNTQYGRECRDRVPEKAMTPMPGPRQDGIRYALGFLVAGTAVTALGVWTGLRRWRHSALAAAALYVPGVLAIALAVMGLRELA